MTDEHIREPDQSYSDRLLPNNHIPLLQDLEKESIIIYILQTFEDCSLKEDDSIETITLKYHRVIEDILPLIENFNIFSNEYYQHISQLESRLKVLSKTQNKPETISDKNILETHKPSVRELRLKFYEKKQ